MTELLCFCSYRRADTEDVVKEVAGRLKQEFGQHVIYRDIEDEPLGSAFERRILKSISTARLVLVFIGNRWSNRLHEVSDMVRREVEMALTFDIPLIPVLVGLPDFEHMNLPPQLSELKGRNWIALDLTKGSDESVSHLISEVESVLYEMRVSLCPVEQELPGPWGTNRDDPVYFYHLSVENLSNGELRDVVVQVATTQLSDNSQSLNGPICRVERPLFWEYGTGDPTKMNIPPLEKRDCNFARLKKQDLKLVLDISGEWPVHQPHVLPKGRMRVELDARSSQGRSRSLLLDIDYDGGWSDRGPDMVKEKHLVITTTPKGVLQESDVKIGAS